MPRSKQAVFISSTCVDLPEHRQHVMAACKELDLDPDALEHWPATSAGGVQESLRRVDEADIYLGIFGQRYGFVPKGQQESVTEMEYRRARARVPAIPLFIFLADPAHPWRINDLETEQDSRDKLASWRRDKIAALRSDLKDNHNCKMFKSAEELHTQAIGALANHLIGELKIKLSTALGESSPQIEQQVDAVEEKQAEAIEQRTEPAVESAPSKPAKSSSPSEDSSQVAVRVLLAASREDNKWDYISGTGAKVPRRSCIRVMALPEIRCYLLLIVEIVGFDGTTLGLNYFGPGQDVEESASFLVEPTGIWQSLPSGNYLQEQLPDKVERWRMGFLVQREPPDQLLGLLAGHASIQAVKKLLPKQPGSVSASRQAVDGPNLAGTVELVRIQGTSPQLHWTEIEFQ